MLDPAAAERNDAGPASAVTSQRHGRDCSVVVVVVDETAGGGGAPVVVRSVVVVLVDLSEPQPATRIVPVISAPAIRTRRQDDVLVMS